MPVSYRCRVGCGHAQCAQCWMGNESGSTLQAWQLLPIRLSARISINAMGPPSDILQLPSINGMSDLP
jgi:hypothetical protein